MMLKMLNPFGSLPVSTTFALDQYDRAFSNMKVIMLHKM